VTKNVTAKLLVKRAGSTVVAGLLIVAMAVAANAGADIEAAPDITGPAKRPNIVLLLADDLGYSDLGAYGSEIQTPNLDRLAASGLRFSNFHVAASCAPTRAMLMTGLNSHSVGVANIPEAIPEDQAHAPAYQGVMHTHVPTIAEQLQAAGYRTVMTGKWHLGMDPERRPSARGFDRTFMLADTGADNWRHRSYLPIYETANWFEDGEPITLPDDFYSSEHLVDKAIEYIGNDGEEPFFAYVAFQAVHIPVQAPATFRDKYLQTYVGGWHALRAARSEGLVDAGILPDRLQGRPMPTTPDWQSLTPDQQAFEAKGMAVYAGMVDAMDHHIGRLINHVDLMGELDNTVFIFLSDNGAEGSLATRNIGGEARAPTGPFRAWMYTEGFNTDIETLGERDSYHDIGPAWASAAVGPLAWYKFFAGEGGLRVPLIISGASNGQNIAATTGGVSPVLGWATDIAPTILELAGIETLDSLPGKTLVPLISGETTELRAVKEGIGYELGGNKAFFRGGYKLVYNRYGSNNRWQLFNLAADPAEKTDLSAAEPQRFNAMLKAYIAWAEAQGVLPVADDYHQGRTVMLKGILNRPGLLATVALLLLLPVLILIALVVWLFRRRKVN
jgi:arylsulfatase/uncharacterized sulfatase